ncbi:MAG: hypothetical protein H6828_10990 [Planctomycetes bacterium]|nr:hypothetical protein [Planctomycetota bacterium]
MDDSPLWIGLDGGATKLALCLVRQDEVGRLVLRAPAQRLAWPADEGFRPLPLEDQLAQLEAGGPRLAEVEQRLGAAWVAACADAVHATARRRGARELRLGLCLAGRKDAAERGVVAALGGPRLPAFAAELEAALRARDLDLGPAPLRLASDGVAAGFGEELALGGALGDARDALSSSAWAPVSPRRSSSRARTSARAAWPRCTRRRTRRLWPCSRRTSRAADDARRLSVEGAAGLGGVQRAFDATGQRRVVTAATQGTGARARCSSAPAACSGASCERASRRSCVREPSRRASCSCSAQRAGELADTRWWSPLLDELDAETAGCEAPRVSALVEAPALGALAAALGRIAAQV